MPMLLLRDLLCPCQERGGRRKKRKEKMKGKAPCDKGHAFTMLFEFFFPSHNKFKITILHLGSIPKEVLHENQPKQLQNHQASYTP
jgi:hypothetical protein